MMITLDVVYVVALPFITITLDVHISFSFSCFHVGPEMWPADLFLVVIFGQEISKFGIVIFVVSDFRQLNRNG